MTALTTPAQAMKIRDDLATVLKVKIAAASPSTPDENDALLALHLADELLREGWVTSLPEVDE